MVTSFNNATNEITYFMAQTGNMEDRALADKYYNCLALLKDNIIATQKYNEAYNKIYPGHKKEFPMWIDSAIQMWKHKIIKELTKG